MRVEVMAGRAAADVRTREGKTLGAIARRRIAEEQDIQCTATVPDLAEALAFDQAGVTHPTLVSLVQDLWWDLDGGHRADYTSASPPQRKQKPGASRLAARSR